MGRPSDARQRDSPTFRLSLLGGLLLEGPDGPLAGRVAQRRQLALLALLATSPTGALRRDKAMAWLWPEANEKRARHLLSDTLFVIRGVLGDAAIEVRGQELRLNPAVVSSDLGEFRFALEAGDFERAIDLYAGPLLDGVDLGDSDELERWVAGERADLERRAAKAARNWAERLQTDGDLPSAERYARKAMAIDATDEIALRSLLRILDAKGDRAGAIRVHEVFEERLAADLDVEPAPETQALVAEIRARDVARKPTRRVAAPASSSDSPDAADAETATRTRRRLLPMLAGASALAAALLVLTLFPGLPTAIPDEGVSIAVLPFDTQGEELNVWREGMVDLVSTNLDAFSKVRAIPSRTVLARWREAGIEPPVELARVLQVARRTEADYAITGSVVESRNGLRIRGELFDLSDGSKVGEAVTIGPPDSVFAVVNRLSVELMTPLVAWPREDTSSTRLADLMPGSAVSLQAFLEGEAFFRSGDYTLAVPAYQQALEADSTFAFGHLRLAQAYGWATGPGTGDPLEEMRLAARHADRLPERRREQVEIYLALFDGDPAVLEMARRAARRYPDDSEVWHDLGEVYFHLGGPGLVRPWDFVEAFERAIALDPSFTAAYEHFIDAGFLRNPDSTRVAELFEQQRSASEVSDAHEVAFGLVFGDPESRDEALVRLRDPTFSGHQAMAVLCLSHPRFLDDRETVLEVASDRFAPNQLKSPVVQWSLFRTLLWRGRLEEALAVAEDRALDSGRATALYAARIAGYPIPESAFVAAVRNAPSGPVDRPSETPVLFERASYAAERGDWPEHALAVRQLRSLIPQIEAESATDANRVRGMIEALEGYAAWQRGDRQTALRHLREGQALMFVLHGRRNLLMLERNRIVRWWLATLLSEMDRPRDALVFYESLGPGKPITQDPMAYFHMGRTRHRLGDRPGALEAYELAALAWSDPDPSMRSLVATASSEAARLRGLVRE